MSSIRVQGHLLRSRASDLSDDRIGLEGSPRVEHPVARAAGDLDQLLEKSDAARPHGNVGGWDVEVRAERIDESSRSEVRVTMKIGQCLLRRTQHGRQRLVVIFIARELVWRHSLTHRSWSSGTVGGDRVEDGAQAWKHDG